MENLLPNCFGRMQQAQKIVIIRTYLTVVSQKYMFSSFLDILAKNEENVYYWLTTVRSVHMISFWTCCIIPKSFGNKFSIKLRHIWKKYQKTYIIFPKNIHFSKKFVFFGQASREAYRWYCIFEVF